MRNYLLTLATVVTIFQNTLAQAPYLNYSAPIDFSQTGSVSYSGISHSISSQQVVPGGLSFSLNGQALFIIGGQLAAFSKISEFSLTNAFDLTDVSFTGNSYSLTSYESHPGGLAFDLYGNKMFTVGTGSSSIHEFALSSTFGITSGVTYNGTPGGNSWEDLAFNTSGTKIIVLGDDANVRQYTITLPYDVINLGGPSYDGTAIDVSNEESSPTDFAFNANGTKLFVLGTSDKKVHQYSVGAPFDITAGVSYDGVAFDISSQESTPTGLTFNNTNTHMYVVGLQNKTVYQYSQSSDVFHETSANDGTLEGSMIVTLKGHTFANAGGTLTSPTHFTISNLPAGLTPSIAVHSSGVYGVLTLSGNATVWNDVSALTFTFTNDAFTSVGAAGIVNAVAGNSKLGIRFNERKLTYSPEIDLAKTNKIIHNSKTSDVSADINVPAGFAFNKDGSKLFVTGLDAEVHEYKLIAPFNITLGAIHQANTLDVSSALTFPQDVAFSDDGHKMYVLGSAEKEINQYALHTPFVISSGVSLEGNPLSLSSQDASPTSFVFDPEGSKLFVVGTTSKAVYQYNLATPFDITSGTSYSGFSFSLSNENTSPRGISFNASGTKMFIVSEGDDEINSYSLATPFDISSGVTFDGSPLSVANEESNPVDIILHPNGTRMFVLGSGDKEISQYNLAFGFEEAGANDGSINGKGMIRLKGGSFTNAGGTLSAGTHYSIANLPAGLTPQIDVYADGKSAVLTLTGNAIAHDYVNAVGNLKLTFTDAAFVNGGAAYIDQAVSAGTGWFISFTGDPAITYHPSIDITASNAIVYSGNHFDLSAEEMTPYDLVFRNDGYKMYVVGYEAKELNQYSLTTPFDVTSSVSFDGTPLDLSAGGFVPVSLAFTPSGEKLIVIGVDGDLRQYSLSTPFSTTSGVTFDGNAYNTQPEVNNCTGLAFSNDGLRMFVIGNGGKSIAQYDLPAYYYITDGLAYAGELFDVSSQETLASDLAFSPDGKKLLVSGVLSKKIHQYSLSSPFDLTSDVTYDSNPYTIPAGAMLPNGIVLGNNGKVLFTVGLDQGVGPTKREINQFAISVNGFYEAPLNNGSVNGGLSVDLIGDTFAHSGGTMTLSADYTITGAPAGLSPILSVDPTGRSAILGWSGQADNHEDADDVAELVITFLNAAFSGNDASAVANSTAAGTGAGIDFRDNNTPTFLSATSADFVENGTGIAMDVQGTDGEGSAADANITYTISGGADASIFSINPATGELSFATAPDFDAPTDANTDNDYVIDVTIDDGSASNGTATQTITISVTDIDEDPVFLSASSADFEENGIGTVLDINASDESGSADEGLIYFTSGGADQAKFTFPSTSDGLLKFVSPPDFENPGDANADNVYEVEVTARDNTGHTSVQVVSITVTDVNEAPVFVTSSTPIVAENTSEAVIDINANNGDGGASDDGITYNISGGVDQSLFSLVTASGVLAFKNPPDFEHPGDNDGNNTYLIEVSAADGEYTTVQALIVSVTNMDDPPIFVSASIADYPENQTSFAMDINANNGDGPTNDELVTYSVVGGTDMTSFYIDQNIGYLYFNVPPDFEHPTDANTDNTYSVEIKASDGVNNTMQTVTITVTNVDESPIFVSGREVSFPENSSETVIDIDANNGDGGGSDVGLSYSIVGGNDQQFFSVDAGSGTVRFIVPPDFENPTDADQANTYEVTISASDGAFSTELGLTVTVTDQDDNSAPTISAQTFTIPENSQSGFVVGTVQANDPEGSALTFAIVQGNTEEGFSISPSTGQLRVASTQVMDFETNPSFSLLIQVTDDQGASASASITVQLTDVDETGNHPPDASNETFTINENSPLATIVGNITASDEDGDNLVFAITAGNIGNAFEVGSNTGQLSVLNPAALDFETTPTFVLSVEVSDGRGGVVTAEITVNLADINEDVGNSAPTVQNMSISIPEQQPVGFLVTKIAASDPDGDALTFTIENGNVGDAFAISAASGQVTVNNSDAVDFETMPSFELTIGVDDGNGGHSNGSLSITLEDVDEGLLGMKTDAVYFKAYPNPTSKDLIIEFMKSPVAASIQVVDMAGKTVYSNQNAKGRTLTVSLADVPVGMYLVNIRLDDGMRQQVRIIKK
ncbi:MAG: cadherin domain-containing protein [Imperialibacter sp.]|uniref:cadherin domain-containing protein n=1 Tax=Imperialibacter sp. TaxID=2038411 RepID=UPI003A8BBF4E